MAKNKSNISVSGKSIQDIMQISDVDFNKLSEGDIRKLTTRLVSAANKRLKRLEKAGIYSVASRDKERFSVKGKNLNELRSTFANVRNFLTSKTSTVKGAKETYSKLVEKVFGGRKLSQEDQDKLWRVIQRLETEKYQQVHQDFYNTTSKIAEQVEAGIDIEDIYNKFRDEYEEEKMLDADELQNPFEWGSNI